MLLRRRSSTHNHNALVRDCRWKVCLSFRGVSRKCHMKSDFLQLVVALELSADQCRRLSVRVRSNAFAASTIERKRFSEVYYDTAELSLASAGLCLCVRNDDGVWTQELRSIDATTTHDASRVHRQSAVAGPEPAPDAIGGGKLARKLKELLIASSPLDEQFGVEIDRTTMAVAGPGGDSMLLELDIGTIAAGKRKVAVRTVCITLGQGRPEALLSFVREITSDGPVRLHTLDRAQAGYRLLSAKAKPEVGASKAPRSTVRSDMTGAEAIVAIAGAVRAHALHNWDVLLEQGSAEAAHQLRVGLRRLRTMLRIVRDTVDGDFQQALYDNARDLGRVVGRLRDTDVLARDIIDPVSLAPRTATGIDALQSLVKAERKGRRAIVREALETPRFGMMRVELLLLPALLESSFAPSSKLLSRPVEDLAAKSLRRLLRRVLRRAEDLTELTVEQRHELRKALKPLRYGVEFFAPLYPAPKIGRFLRRASQLQATLGYLNDVALAETLLQLDPPAGKAALDVDTAIGAVIGWHAAKAEQAWSDVKRTWRGFSRAAEFLA